MKTYLKCMAIFYMIFGFQNILAENLLVENVTTFEINQPSDTDRGIILVSVTYEENQTLLTMKCVLLDNNPAEVALSPDDSNGSFVIRDLEGKKHYKLLKSSGIAIIPKWSKLKKKGESLLFTLAFEKMPLHKFALLERNGESYDSWHFNNINVEKKYIPAKKPVYVKTNKEKVTILDAKNYETFVNQKEKNVIVKYGAEWCGACKDMEPKFKEASKSMQDKIAFGLADVDELDKVSRSLNVESIPTTILFHKGKEAARHVGSMDEEEILTWISSYEK